MLNPSDPLKSLLSIMRGVLLPLLVPVGLVLGTDMKVVQIEPTVTRSSNGLVLEGEHDGFSARCEIRAKEPLEHGQEVPAEVVATMQLTPSSESMDLQGDATLELKTREVTSGNSKSTLSTLNSSCDLDLPRPGITAWIFVIHSSIEGAASRAKPKLTAWIRAYYYPENHTGLLKWLADKTGIAVENLPAWIIAQALPILVLAVLAALGMIAYYHRRIARAVDVTTGEKIAEFDSWLNPYQIKPGLEFEVMLRLGIHLLALEVMGLSVLFIALKYMSMAWFILSALPSLFALVQITESVLHTVGEISNQELARKKRTAAIVTFNLALILTVFVLGPGRSLWM